MMLDRLGIILERSQIVSKRLKRLMCGITMQKEKQWREGILMA
jgi:hypothetical protein